MWMWWLTAALAADPALHVAWKAEDGRLWVRSPEGEHVAPDAPLSAEVTVGRRTVSVEGLGAALADGLALGEVRASAVTGRMRLSLCEDGGTACRLVDLVFDGRTSDRRRGTAVLEVATGVPSPEPEPPGFPAQVDADAVWEEAVAEAKASGRPILVDFGAVWCPPCNRLSAEVLHAQPRPAQVDAFVLAEVDVDDPSANGLKDRFAVGGYPTLVAVQPDGTELGRLVGYPGPSETVAWLDRAATADAYRPAGAPSGPEAARRAWELARAGDTARARSFLELAGEATDQPELYLARLVLEDDPEAAAWLAEHAVADVTTWAPWTRGIQGEGLDAQLAAAFQRGVTTADPLDAADLLALAAERRPEAEATLYAAAAALVRAELVGEPRRDKGHLGWLAWLTEHGGDVDAAVALLEKARADWPDEPTFHVALARMLLRHDRFPEALAVSERAVETSWGDNRLTAAGLKVRALQALGRHDEAHDFGLQILAEHPEPAADAEVRAHRMRRELASLIAP